MLNEPCIPEVRLNPDMSLTELPQRTGRCSRFATLYFPPPLKLSCSMWWKLVITVPRVACNPHHRGHPSCRVGLKPSMVCCPFHVICQFFCSKPRRSSRARCRAGAKTEKAPRSQPNKGQAVEPGNTFLADQTLLLLKDWRVCGTTRCLHGVSAKCCQACDFKANTEASFACSADWR